MTYDPLRDRVQALEREIALLRQGVHQATRMRLMWEQAIAELQAARQRLNACNAEVAVFHRLCALLAAAADTELPGHALDALLRIPGVATERPAGIVLRNGAWHLAVRRNLEDPEAHALVERCVDALDNLNAGAGLFCLLSGSPAAVPVMIPLEQRGLLIGGVFFEAFFEPAADATFAETCVAVGHLLTAALARCAIPRC